MSLGIVYIARNDTHEPNVYKIGMTLRTNLSERMDELTGHTGVLGEFRHEGHVLVDDVEECERKLHEKFSYCRVQNNREFFRASLREIIFEFNNILSEKIIRNNLPPIDNHSEVKPDYFLKFNNLMSFLRFYQNYGCGVEYCGLCSGVPNAGIILFLCKAIGYDLSSKEKRFHLFNKIRGMEERPYRHGWEDNYNHFRDLTNEYKKKIYGELITQLSNLSENELNNLTMKMIRFLNSIIDNRYDDEDIKKIFNLEFKNFFTNLSKLTETEIDNFSKNKFYFIEHLLNDLDNDEDLQDIFYQSAILEKIRESRRASIAAQEAYQRELQQKYENDKFKKEQRLKQKQKEHKIFLEKQKSRNEKREAYISNLRNMSLVDRIKKIIEVRPYGLVGIPKELFEIESLSNIIPSLSKDEIKRFQEILKNRNDKFFKKINKILNEI